MKAGGLPSESDYPYCTNGTLKGCDPCSAKGYNKTRCGPGLEPPMCNETKWPCMEGKFPVAAKISNWSAINRNETVMAA